MPLRYVSQSDLQAAFRYEDGCLYRIKTGKLAGCYKRPDKYGIVSINGKYLLIHRAVWIYHNGEIPDNMFIDHIDCDKTNNRIENLRLVSKAQNAFNSNVRKDNVSGVKNVRWNEATKSWRVKMTLDGKTRHFGLYATLEEAAAVAHAMREKHHGQYANHGLTIGGSHSYST